MGHFATLNLSSAQRRFIRCLKAELSERCLQLLGDLHRLVLLRALPDLCQKRVRDVKSELINLEDKLTMAQLNEPSDERVARLQAARSQNSRYSAISASLVISSGEGLYFRNILKFGWRLVIIMFTATAAEFVMLSLHS